MKKLASSLAEGIGTFALIFVGIGAIKASPNDLLAVAFAHGITIAVFATALMHVSGGQFNPAVTLGLLVGGKIDSRTAVRFWAAQLIGATLAAFLCLALFDRSVVANGTPRPGLGISPFQAIVVEAVLTFFLVFVVYGTAVDQPTTRVGGLAIGMTVTLDILFGGPLTGAAMNPARTFGPALAASAWDAHYVYWLGPLIGGALAGWVYKTVFLSKS